MNSSPSIQYMRTKFSENDAKIIRSVMLSFDYRNAQNPFEKVNALVDANKHISIANACKAVGISTKTYYKIKNHDDSEEDNASKGGPNQLLTFSEEQMIIDEIGKAQRRFDCLRGFDVKEMAQNKYFNRTGEQRAFGRDWFYRFLTRYSEKVGKMKSTSVDDERSSLSLDAINQYINAVLDALTKITDLRLLLNMDECGFSKRSQYKKKRTCVFLKDCDVPPLWHASNDIYHISWVCCISAACSWTRHMLISTRKHMDPDFSETFLNEFAEYTSSLKGYMVTENMIKWVQDILVPYVTQIRLEINNENHPVVLIFDNLYQHLSSEVMAEFDKIQPVILIPLPPHSSHITQPCDSCVFASSKTRFNQLPNDTSKTRFTAKLCKIKKAIEQTLSKEIVLASWQHCGFKIGIKNGICSTIEFTKEFQDKLRSMAVDKNQ